jgi:major membrane immunogen (membrane-anchored lipoprotein)
MRKSAKCLGVSGSIVLLFVALSRRETAKLEVEQILVHLEQFIETNPIPSVEAVFGFVTEMIEAPSNAQNARDGVFKAESIYDNFGYRHVITLEVKDEKIVSVHYDEQKKDGHGKRSDEDYCKEMKAGSGASPAEFYPHYEQALLQSQDLGKIDGVSGATYSLYRFKTTAIRALRKAAKKQFPAKLGKGDCPQDPQASL